MDNQLIERMSRSQYFMKLAHLTALRGTCLRAKVGCILVTSENLIVSTGYNSSYPGSPHCIDEGCLVHENHCRRCLHAELSAVLRLEKRYKELTAYITHEPCSHCYQVLCNSGVTEIIYLKSYGKKPDYYLQLIKEIKIEPQQYQEGDV